MALFPRKSLSLRVCMQPKGLSYTQWYQQDREHGLYLCITKDLARGFRGSRGVLTRHYARGTDEGAMGQSKPTANPRQGKGAQ